MTNIRDECFPGTIASDFFNMVCGRMLGMGAGRTVYENRLDPTTVVKFETGGRSFQNIMEWEFWQANKENDEVSQWLAPCVTISGAGTILIQKRTEPISRCLLPEKVPVWACDLKQENWSLLDDRPVMHDYGLNMVLESASKRLKKAEWRENF